MAKTGQKQKAVTNGLRRHKVPNVWSPKPYLFAAARRIFRWSPERKACLKAAETIEGYKCASCSLIVAKTGCAVDHISAVVDPQRGFSGWCSYYDRLFCGRSNLQVLCKGCHSAKSKAENAIRREVKARAKDIQKAA